MDRLIVIGGFLFPLALFATPAMSAPVLNDQCTFKAPKDAPPMPWFTAPLTDEKRAAFAIPEDGKPHLGIQYGPISGLTDEKIKAQFAAAKFNGLIVGQVADGSVAQKAGVQAGDYFYVLNGMPVASQADMVAAMATVKMGDSITACVLEHDPNRKVFNDVSVTLQFRTPGSGPDWLVKDENNPLDGKRDYTALLHSSNTLTASIGQPERASLIIRCSGGKYEVYVTIPQILIGQQFVHIRYKFDGEELTTQTWAMGQGGNSAFAELPYGFSQDMAGLRNTGHLSQQARVKDGQPASKLLWGFTPDNGVESVAEFDLDGVAGVVRAATTACPKRFFDL